MKVKYFTVLNSSMFERQVNSWLNEHPTIIIVSTNSFANVGGWGYIILYREGQEA